MIYKQFKSVKEAWKHGGVAWQILSDGSTYDVSANPLCLNCLCELDGLRCSECGKQHKLDLGRGVLEAATLASKSYNAARRRKHYTITAPQIGEKLAEADLTLSNSRFMNVRLEKRKHTEQVVITVGKKGENDKAQIFVDLTKDEIRNDETNLDPQDFVSSVKLNTDKHRVSKDFSVSQSSRHLEHPYIYVCSGVFQQWSNGVTASLNLKNTEPEEYFLQSMEIEDHIIEPNRSLVANGVTKGISVPDVTQIFKKPNPHIKIVVNRANSTYMIYQEIKTTLGVDNQHHFAQFVEKPTITETPA